MGFVWLVGRSVVVVSGLLLCIHSEMFSAHVCGVIQQETKRERKWRRTNLCVCNTCGAEKKTLHLNLFWSCGQYESWMASTEREGEAENHRPKECLQNAVFVFSIFPLFLFSLSSVSVVHSFLSFFEFHSVIVCFECFPLSRYSVRSFYFSLLFLLFWFAWIVFDCRSFIVRRFSSIECVYDHDVPCANRNHLKAYFIALFNSILFLLFSFIRFLFHRRSFVGLLFGKTAAFSFGANIRRQTPFVSSLSE